MDNNYPNLPAEELYKIMAEAAPVLIWISGVDKLCYYFNKGWLDFTGRTLVQESGKGWTEGIHPADLERCLDIFENSFDAKRDFKLEFRLRRNDGQFRWQFSTGVPRYDKNNQFAGFIGTCVDIDDLLQSQRYVTNYLSTEALKKEQHLNEDLAAANEEMTASNEELAATIEELQQTQEDLSMLNHTLEEKVAERVKDLANTESSLRSLVMTAHYPLMILRGRDWIIEIANQQLVNLWDKTIVGVTGHKLMDILPEIEDQPFPGYLRQVYDTGIGYGDEEQIFYYNSPTGPAIKYVSYYYDPLLDENGEVCGIIVAADDITEKVKSRQLLEKSYQKEQALNEEFVAINEELATTIEELSAANDELAISEERFRGMIRQAPVGICVIRAKDLTIQEVNDGYLALVGKMREELEHRTIWDAVPEAAESYASVLQNVIDSGVAFVATEHDLFLLRNGRSEKVFVDFVYEPVKNLQGIVASILVLCIDVTDKVLARKGVEEMEERVRLAVEAAEIGTFDHSYLDNTLLTSDRFNAIFGFKYTVSRKEFLDRLHPEDVHLSAEAHIAAAKSGKLFYEARLLYPDGSLRWIRAQGNVYYGKDNKPERLLGTLLDITEFKRLQQQKDDFISIASHELKTPLTSLKASLQLLERLKTTPSSPVIPKLIEQSSRSMGKITELVDDLLNVSRMNEGQITLNKKLITLSAVIKDCCNDTRAQGKHQLIFKGDEQLQVYADENRIEQVIVNFVNNAIKYAPVSYEIELLIERQAEVAKVSVKDNGPGIDPEKLPHLFDRYYRADFAGNQVSGLGLGLYISADIINRHGGKIGVDSVQGKGSTFWFTLPIN